jgi:hypothetical protein
MCHALAMAGELAALRWALENGCLFTKEDRSWLDLRQELDVAAYLGVSS